MSWVKCPIKAGCAFCDLTVTDRHHDWDKLWGFFQGHIYCINLLDRDDRFRRSQEEFHRVGLCTHVKYYRTRKPNETDVPKGMKRGVYGCWLSHVAVNREADSSDAEYALIFEDDVKFLEVEPNVIQQLIDALRSEKMKCTRWDFLYLGYAALAAHFFEKNILQTKNFRTEAYISSKCGRVQLKNAFDSLGLFRRTFAIDEWMIRYSVQLGWFPCLATQNEALPTSLDYNNRHISVANLHARNAQYINYLTVIVLPVFICLLLAVAIFYLYRHVYFSKKSFLKKKCSSVS